MENQAALCILVSKLKCTEELFHRQIALGILMSLYIVYWRTASKLAAARCLSVFIEVRDYWTNGDKTQAAYWCLFFCPKIQLSHLNAMECTEQMVTVLCTLYWRNVSHNILDVCWGVLKKWWHNQAVLHTLIPVTKQWWNMSPNILVGVYSRNGDTTRQFCMHWYQPQCTEEMCHS